MTAATAAPSGVPATDIDPYSMEFLADPYPFHARLQELGPLVWLEKYDAWAATHEPEVRTILSDWETFCSSAGVGLSNFRKEKPWRPPSLLIEADPPLHTRTRTVITRILSPASLRSLKETFEREARALIGQLVERGSFDAVANLAEAYPLKVFPDAVGLPAEGRENLIPYGSMAFNAFGPRNKLFEEGMRNGEKAIPWILANCKRAALAPEGLGLKIFEAADSGILTEEEAELLARSFLTAGVDTTVNGLGNMILCFARFPDQWRLLRENPGQIRPAFDEVLRFEPSVQRMFRTTTREIEIAGIRMNKDDKVLCFMAAANRDPRRWENPHTFDIMRKTTGHLGFGVGIHACVGQVVARMEAEAVLAALVERVRSIELAGEPVQRLNNTLRGLASLPVRVVAN